MNNITGALYRVGKYNETKCSRVKSVLRQRQFKKRSGSGTTEVIAHPWRAAAGEDCSKHVQLARETHGPKHRAFGKPKHQSWCKFNLA